MPPKKKITREQLVETALAIANEEGLGNITIRKIANRLECSIAPIYVNFKDVEELKQEVVAQAMAISKALILEQNSGDPFLDIGIASVIFAKRYPLLFDELGIKDNQHYGNQIESKNFVIQQMKQDTELSTFKDLELELLLLKMQAFQAGLSLLARKEQYSNILTDDMIIKILSDTGNDILNGMKERGRH